MSLQDVSLGDLLTLERRRIPVDPTQSYPEVGVYCFGRGLFHKEPRSGLEVGDKHLFSIREGDFILQVTFAWEGAVAVASKEDERFFGSVRVLTFRVNEERCLPKYLYHYFRTLTGVEQLGRISPGSAGRNRVLSAKRIPEVTVPLPPLSEQRRIVAKIEQIAAKIEEAQRLRTQSGSLSEVSTAATLSHLFDFRESDCLPCGWSWNVLPLLLSDPRAGMMTGPFGTLLQKSEILDSGVPILGIENVATDRFVPGFRSFVSNEKACQLQSYRLIPRDIVIARSGTVGRSCLIPDDLPVPPIMSTNLMRLRLNEEMFLPELLSRLFNSSSLVERLKNAECRGSSPKTSVFLGPLSSLGRA